VAIQVDEKTDQIGDLSRNSEDFDEMSGSVVRGKPEPSELVLLGFYFEIGEESPSYDDDLLVTEIVADELYEPVGYLRLVQCPFHDVFR
jgi:hypothetical protein